MVCPRTCAMLRGSGSDGFLVEVSHMRWLFLCMFFAAASAVAPAVSQEMPAPRPSYLILRVPAAPAPHGLAHGHYPGNGVAVEATPYAYGWFGVQPRRHWSRHFGYYREYTEWSAR